MKKQNVRKIILMASIAIMILLTAVSLLVAKRAYMGVYTDKWNFKANEYAKDYKHGIIISKVVKNSPAEKAGVRANDLLLELNGEKIYTMDQLTKMLENYQPGDKIKIEVIHSDGDKEKIKMELGAKDEVFQKPKIAYVGIYLDNLDEDDYEELGMKEEYGIEIEKIVTDSPADKAGLKNEDVILKLNDNKVYTKDQFSHMLKSYKPKDKIILEIMREKKKNDVEIILGEKEIKKGIFGGDLEIPESVFMYKYQKEMNKGLGITVKTVLDENRENSPVNKGVRIVSILPKTPAENANLQIGDIITKADEEEIEDIADLKDVIEDKEIDESVKLQVVRAKNLLTKIVKIAELPQTTSKMNKVKVFFDDGEVKMEINGEESTLLELEKIFESLKNLKNLKELKKLEEIEALEDLELDEMEKELKIKVLSKEKGML